jgi:hypothetical protein
MSASNEWTEWHLTPRGWERGTEKEDFRREDRDPPHDRVLTVVYKEYVASSFSGVETSSRTTFVGGDVVTVEAFQEKFGPPPNHL